MDATQTERVPKRIRIMLLVTVLLTFGAVGLVVIGRAVIQQSLRHLDFGNPTNQRAALTKVLDAVQIAARAQSDKCRVVLDESSLGDLDREAKMLILADLLRVYQADFGKVPHSVGDLQAGLYGSDEANKSAMNKLQDYWFVYDDTSAWFVLGYGGWRPSSVDLSTLAASAGRIEKFHKLGEHEVLFIPGEKCP
jgi:hypothetical protein